MRSLWQQLAFCGLCICLNASAYAAVEENLALPLQPNSSDNLSYTCIGTQPFWRLDINYQGLKFNDPMQKSFMMPFVFPKTAEGVSSQQMQIFKTKEDNKNVYVILRKTGQACSNGLAGSPGTYEGTVIFPDKVLVGCCG